MATDSAARSVTNTLTTTTADAITLTQPWAGISVTNHDATNALYFRQDGTTAVGEANDTTVVLPGQTVVASANVTSSKTVVVSVVGNGNKYTVEGVN